MHSANAKMAQPLLQSSAVNGAKTLIALLAALLVQLSGRPAFADAIDDCNSNDESAVVTGCEAVITQKLLDGSQLAIAYSRRSDIYLAKEAFAQAVADRKKAIELAPDEPTLRERLVAAYLAQGADHRDHGRLAEAQSAYQDALAVDAKNADAVAGLADAAVASGKADEAFTAIARLASLKPGDARIKSLMSSAHVVRGQLALAADKLKDAEESLTKALDLNPSNAVALKLRGMALAAGGQSEQALVDLSAYSALEPKKADGYVLQAEQYRKIGSLDQAWQHCDRALELEPKNIDALLLRGLAFQEQKKFVKALRDFDAALTIDPSNQPARSAVERLRAEATTVSTLDEAMRVRLTRFVNDYMEAGVAGNSDLKTSFAAQVEYGGKVVSRSDVEKDKRQYYARWFKRHYAMRPETLVLKPGSGNGRYSAFYEYEFRVTNDEREVFGTGKTVLEIIDDGGMLLITSEKDHVLEKQANVTSEIVGGEGTKADEEVGGGWWDHNGSQMTLLANGPSRQFIYGEPRSGLGEIGITTGTILFKGQRQGNHYSGTAYAFSKKCGKIAFPVEGGISDRVIVLEGEKPKRDGNCNQVGMTTERLVFSAIGME